MMNGKFASILWAVIFFIPSFGWSQESNSSAGCWSGNDGATNWYADSLNLIKKRSQLPNFVSDFLIDWELRHRLRGCLKVSDEIVSFRVEVLDRVYREDVLEWIINSNNTNYDSIYVPKKMEKKIKANAYHDQDFPEIVFMEFSWRDLAKLRLEALRKRKKIINKN